MWNYEHDASGVCHTCQSAYVYSCHVNLYFFLSNSIYLLRWEMLKYSLIYVQSFYLSWSFSDYVVYFLCGPIFQLCGLFAMWSICDFLIFQINFEFYFQLLLCYLRVCVVCGFSFVQFQLQHGNQFAWILGGIPGIFCFLNMEAAL